MVQPLLTLWHRRSAVGLVAVHQFIAAGQHKAQVAGLDGCPSKLVKQADGGLQASEMFVRKRVLLFGKTHCV